MDLAIRSLHIIAIVSWFAGLLYEGRLLIYHVEAEKREDSEKKIIQDQLEIMMRRLWYAIAWPGMIATIGFGFWMMIKFDLYQKGWLHLKLLLVFGVVGYHIMLGKLRKRMMTKTNKLSSFKLRIINEVGTLFLVAIVFTAYFKDFFNRLWGGIFIVGLLLMLLVAIHFFQRFMKKHT